MHRSGMIVALGPRILVVLMVLAASGCAPGRQGADNGARQAEWESLAESHEALSAKRQELRELRERIAAGPETVEEGETGEGGISPEELHLRLQEQVGEIEEEVTGMADQFMIQLVGFINADPIIEGEEPTEIQLAAIRMKSDEDIELAQEYIDKGGDYRRAIDIYNAALSADPEYERLAELLGLAEEMRYMDEERFAEVRKAMTQDEVRAVLGQVYHRNIRDFEKEGVVGWFYPKEGGGAAAVFFREDRRSGQLRVYNSDYNAVKTTEVEEGTGG